MITIYFEGDDFFAQLKKDIEQAKRKIFIEFYIFQTHNIGREILSLLRDKNKKENIPVKIHVDGIGSRDYIPEIQNFIKNTTIEFSVYKPLRFQFLIRSEYHRRNHRKLILIDDRILYTGGMNIKDVMSQKAWGMSRWRDTMLRLENSSHKEIQRIFRQSELDFLNLWKLSQRGYYFLPAKFPVIPSLTNNKHYLIFSSVNRKRQKAFRKFYFEFIKKTREFLYIATPYFVPPLRLIRLLKQKAEEGVDVQILTAGNTDVWLARQAGRAIYSHLLKSRIKIYEFKKRVFHAKQTMSENGIIVGSSNIDYRSFLHNLEIDIYLSKKSIVEKALRQWRRDLEESEEIVLNEWNRRKWIDKITESLAYGLRYYL